ncbi:MAG: winged helix-turn-helix transcriptional regulator [Candidatus Hodarchaeales archaeon]
MPLKTVDDIRFILALQENPFASHKQIAQMLKRDLGIDVSHFTVSKRLKKLREEEMYWVHADLHHEHLGLENISCFIDASTPSQMKKIEQFADIHPYTTYRGRYLGHSSGVLLQFNLPVNSRKSFVQSLDILKENNVLDSYVIDYPLASCNTVSVLNAWDGHDWICDWDALSSNVDKSPSNEIIQSNRTELLTNKLTKDDLKLLSALNQNAGLRNSELAEKVNLSKNLETYQLSRKIKSLRDNFIKNYRIFMHTKAFGIFNLFSFRCKCSEEKVSKLYNFLNNSPEEFIFRSSFLVKSDYDGFTWHIGCPPTHFSPLSQFLLDYTDNVELYISLYDSVITYPLYADAFDESTKTWKNSEDYLVKNVITTLEI